MSTIELKERLIEKIQITDNDNLLEEVYRLLEFDSDESDMYILNENQLAAIQESRQQIKEGKYFTDEQVNKEIDEWLEK